MKTHGIDIQQDGINITNLSDDSSLPNNDTTLITSKAFKDYVDDKVGSGCRVYRNSAQSIPSATWTKIEFNTEDYDNLGEYDHVTNHRFKATKAGIYLVCSAVHILSVDDNSRNLISVYKNGSEYTRGLDFTVGAITNVSPFINVPVKMAANDYVEIWVWQNSAGARNTYTTANSVYMIVQKIA